MSAEERLVELEGPGEAVDVLHEDGDRERRSVDPRRRPLAAHVDVDDAKALLAQGIEPGAEVVVIEPGAAVQHDQRVPGADLDDRDGAAVVQLDKPLLRHRATR